MIKKGDKVLCLASLGGFTKGKVYVLREDFDGKRVRVVANDNGYPDGWDPSKFRNYISPEEKFLQFLKEISTK